MISIACCDDNDLQLELLKDILNLFSHDRILDISVDTYASGKDLLMFHAGSRRYDIYILDVLLPDMNGLEIASILRNRQDNGAIIFLSSTSEYAVSSYDVDASYYLLKPLDRDKLYRVLDRTIAKMKSKIPEFRFHSKNGEVFLPIQKIMYITLENRCAHVFMSDKKEYVSPVLRGSFRNEMSVLLDNVGFSFSTATTLVNLSYVDALDDVEVIMKDNAVLPVSRAMYPDLKFAWRQFTLRLG